MDDNVKKNESYLQNKSDVEIRIFDHKNDRVFYKRLTNKEVVEILAILGNNIKWE